MATLEKIGEDFKYPLDLPNTRIGRAEDNDIVIEDEAVSGYHAMITIKKSPGDSLVNIYIIEDLDSTNNTYINSMKVSSRQMKDGDIIRIGNTRMKFSTKEYKAPQPNFGATQKLNKLGKLT